MLTPLPRYPSLFQLNARVRLTALSRQLDRAATLDDMADAELDRIAEQGFDWVWLLGVWTTGAEGREISLSHPEWLAEYAATLDDFTPADVGGSCFAIRDYRVSPQLGGDAALARLRARLAERGLRLMLDFVPNHMAPDHPWVSQSPEFFVPGTPELLAARPENYRRVAIVHEGIREERIIAYGRDPYFSGWPDTLQLNYANPALQRAMIGELARIAEQCDGVRCDMAMLLLPDVFQRTWGLTIPEFWPQAIAQIKSEHPNFTMMAEVYWDLEFTLQRQGFDYCYDKRLYDRLREARPRPIHDHLLAGLDYQDRLVRFLENHDEPRAAATFSQEHHRAAAIVTFCAPGLRFFHQGQLEGFVKRISPHLVRGPNESTNPDIAAFYNSLLQAIDSPILREGDWRQIDARQAWEGNPTHDHFLLYHWRHSTGERLVAVNFSPTAGQCRVPLSIVPAGSEFIRFRDLMSSAAYDRPRAELRSAGLFLDLRAWGYHVLEVDDI